MKNTKQTAGTQAWRVSIDSPPVPGEERVVIEAPLTISIDGVGDYTLMCTPSNAAALAVGFVFTEGLISDCSDIHLLQQCEDDPCRIRMRLADPRLEGGVRARNMIVASSCGMCGLEKIEQVLSRLPTCGQTLRVPLSLILAVHEAMRSQQSLFRETGGSHAAAIFAPDGLITALAEDIGRHNALDKAIGNCLLSGGQVDGAALAFSGRASFEILAKAARAGIELIAAVSAPSSLAIEAARRCGITLLGFVRENRATIYCHPSRVQT
ncbi:MAG: formate dehydrogenase accessory sulfurtransferase FdhD [Armatimonadota bacterium]